MVTGDRVRAGVRHPARRTPACATATAATCTARAPCWPGAWSRRGRTCVTVNTGYWDHHNDIEKNLEEHLPPLDPAIATLVEDLDRRGMLDDVLIFCAGEFGRTPLINGHAGRDHWSNCFTVLFGGGGLKGGQVVGASEPRGGGASTSVRSPPRTSWPRSTGRSASPSTCTSPTPRDGPSASSGRASRSRNSSDRGIP